MGVYIKCPQCGEELNHDSVPYHLDKEFFDTNVLLCWKCAWVGVVKLGVEFTEIKETRSIDDTRAV